MNPYHKQMDMEQLVPTHILQLPWRSIGHILQLFWSIPKR